MFTKRLCIYTLDLGRKPARFRVEKHCVNVFFFIFFDKLYCTYLFYIIIKILYNRNNIKCGRLWHNYTALDNNYYGLYILIICIHDIDETISF